MVVGKLFTSARVAVERNIAVITTIGRRDTICVGDGVDTGRNGGQLGSSRAEEEIVDLVRKLEKVIRTQFTVVEKELALGTASLKELGWPGWELFVELTLPKQQLV